MKGLQFRESFTPQSCKKQYNNTMTIAAGSQMKEIYAEASRHKVTVVGGFDPNVGIGGYITGGGHSIISPTYGLASDHLVEVQLVTPDGRLVTANECQNTNLFWATKGVSALVSLPSHEMLSILLTKFPRVGAPPSAYSPA